MKVTIVVVRVLLGLAFTIFGLNGLHPFMPAQYPSGDALTWFGIMASSHYIAAVFLCQLVGGLLLLIGRFVPLGLTILGPVIVNILLYHATLWPHMVAPALLVAVLELFLIYAYRLSFRGLFDAKPEVA